MKKQLSVILAILLTVSMTLSACAGQKDENVKGQITTLPPGEETGASTDAKGQISVLPSGEETAAPTEEPTAPTEESVAPTEETAPAGDSVTMGQVEGGIYTNEYAGFGIRLNSNWLIYSAEELQDIPSNIAELLEGTELGDSMDESKFNMFTDMMAESAEDIATMNVLYQKMSFQERIAYAAASEEEIVDAILDQADMLTESYTQAGMDVESIEKTTVKFLGEERFAIRTVATVQDVPCYILQVYFFHEGQYGVTLTFSSYVEDKTEDLAALCYSLD